MSDLLKAAEALPDYCGAKRRPNQSWKPEYKEPAQILKQKGYPLIQIAELLGKQAGLSKAKQAKLYAQIRSWNSRGQL